MPGGGSALPGQLTVFVGLISEAPSGSVTVLHRLALLRKARRQRQPAEEN